MTPEQKTKINAAAEKAAAAAAAKAKTATGWKKWLYFAAAIAAGAVMVFTMTGCIAGFSQTPETTMFHVAILPVQK